ncbi:MAG: TonB-dependent receptor [Idiomarina sp.]|nr:TonB-dependent receptor [Idiomarina sp.]
MNFLQNPWFIDDPESFRQNGLIPEGQPGANVFSAGSSSTPCGFFQIASNPDPLTLRPCMDAGGGSTWDPTGFTPTAADFDTYRGAPDSYNYAPVNYLQTPFTRFNGMLSTNIDISPDVTAFADVRFNKRTSAQELAPTPFFSIFDTPGLVIPESNFYNPFDEDVIGWRRRIDDNGFARRFEYDVTQFQTTVGLEGILMNEYFWDVSFGKGYRTTTNVDFGQLYSPNLANAIGPSFQDEDGTIVCGTPDNVIAGCVPMNFFGGTGSITQDMLDYVTAPLVDNTINELDQLQLNLSGELFDLPAGPVEFAVGYEYRREKVDARVDSGKFMESVSGNVGRGVTGTLITNAQYFEANVPLLADVPLANYLEASIGVRRDDNSIFGDNTTFALGVRWQPVDGLLIRGTYGDVFRALPVSTLFAPPSDSFPAAQDPCRIGNWDNLSGAQQSQCVATGVPQGGVNTTDTQVRARVGGNPDLQPETGTSLTVGLAYSPDWLPGFNVTVDYFAFDIDDVIASVSASNTLVGCYTGFVDSLCANINRLENGFIDSIDAAANLANEKVSGIDAEFRYTFDTEFGMFRAFLGWTHLLERETTQFATQGFATKPLRGYHDLASSDTYAENKINFRLNWTMDNLSVNYAVEWIGGVQYEATFFEGGFQNVDGQDQYVFGELIDVPAQMYHDISGTYDFGQGTRLSLGITNLLDKAPPYIDAGFNGSTDPSTYRLFGRTAYLRLSHSF